MATVRDSSEMWAVRIEGHRRPHIPETLPPTVTTTPYLYVLGQSSQVSPNFLVGAREIGDVNESPHMHFVVCYPRPVTRPVVSRAVRAAWTELPAGNAGMSVKVARDTGAFDYCCKGDDVFVEDLRMTAPPQGWLGVDMHRIRFNDRKKQKAADKKDKKSVALQRQQHMQTYYQSLCDVDTEYEVAARVAVRAYFDFESTRDYEGVGTMFEVERVIARFLAGESPAWLSRFMVLITERLTHR